LRRKVGKNLPNIFVECRTVILGFIDLLTVGQLVYFVFYMPEDSKAYFGALDTVSARSVPEVPEVLEERKTHRS